MAELTERHNPSPRQIKFRDEYRSQIHPSYNGPFHIGVIYVVGIAVVTWCVGRLENASWEWLLVVPVFVPAIFSLYFDLFDGLIQTYVFVFLTSLFMKESIGGEE